MNKFEKLLGQHISTVENSIGKDFENNLFQKSFYFISDEQIKKDFYGLRYNMLSIITDDKEMVKSISIHLSKVIDRQFYDKFVENYGKPNNIQVISNRRTISESKTEDGILRKGEIDLREGSFDEKPLYIIWEKENYKIKAFLRHKQNMSEITFSAK